MTKMLAAGVHIGTNNSDLKMKDYIWKARPDGLHIMNLGKTWEKLMLAARMIVAIENPADVICVSSRPFGQRAVLKYSQYTGSQAIAGRFTPGTFTNQKTRQFKEPRLLVITDPRIDSQSVKEASYVGIPVIALCDSDTPLNYVDCAIPCNNKSKHSIGLMYWLLAREVLRMRGTVPRDAPWDVPVDLFFYRDIEELEKQEEARAFEEQQTAPSSTAYKETSVVAGSTFKDESYSGAPEQPSADWNAGASGADGWDGNAGAANWQA